MTAGGIRLFFVLAVAVMAVAQMAHAKTGFLDAVVNAHTAEAEHHPSGTQHSGNDCPAHHCCNFHSQAALGHGEICVFSQALQKENSYPVLVEIAPESPIQEIEHPPRLS